MKLDIAVAQRKAKHVIKDTIDDIMVEQKAARRLTASLYIDWKKVDRKLDKHLQILLANSVSSHSETESNQPIKIRGKMPKKFTFYAIPIRMRPIAMASSISIVTGSVFCFLGAGWGAVIGGTLNNRLIEGVARMFITNFNSSVGKGIALGSILGLTCGMGMGLCVGFAAVSLYMYVRRISIPVLEIFSRHSDCVFDDQFVHATIDISNVGAEDL